MNIKSRQIKEILVQLAVNDELPMDLTQLDASIFDVVFEEDEPIRLYTELGKYLSNDGEDCKE